MPVIRIDDEVWNLLGQRARPFVDSPNDVLRRLLGLSNAPSSEAQNKPGAKTKDGDSTMRNIRPAALKWFSRELSNPSSSVSNFLTTHKVRERGFSFYKKCVRTSKYFRAGESYPGIPVWWLQIPLDWVLKPNDQCASVWLLCQKEPDSLLDFWCLAVPIEHLNSEYSNGNLGTLGNNICLHLSTESCTYRGYVVQMLDDVRLTMSAGHRPTPFGQFLLRM